MAEATYCKLSGYFTQQNEDTGYPRVSNPFFRTWDLSGNPEAQNKIMDLFLWLKEKNLLEECGIRDAFIPSPIFSKYTAPAIRAEQNLDVEPLEEGNLDMPHHEDVKVKRSVSSGNTSKGKRGRPKGSKSSNPSTVKAYAPTGRGRGRPPGSKNKPK